RGDREKGMRKTARGVPDRPASRKVRLSLAGIIGAVAVGGVLLGKTFVLGGAFPMRLDPLAQSAVAQYLSGLSEESSQQGVWLQSEQAVLAHPQGTVPLPVASLTKIATSLAALQVWGPTYQFMTLISITGSV